MKAKTKEESRQEFVDHIRFLVRYWENTKDTTQIDKLNGLAFSILNIFDGTSGAMPALDIVLRPHEDDKQYCIDNGDDYYEVGQVINDDVMLHEMYYGTKDKEHYLQASSKARKRPT